MADELYTVQEVSKILKTNPSYVYKLHKSGLLRFIKVGSLKCRKSTLEKFLADYEGMDISDPYNVQTLETEIKSEGKCDEKSREKEAVA